MIDFTYNPIIPADYKSRGRGLPYEASPFAAFFLAVVLAFSMLSLTAMADAAPTITVAGNDSAPSPPAGKRSFRCS